jgi:hypothetical protein
VISPVSGDRPGSCGASGVAATTRGPEQNGRSVVTRRCSLHYVR